MSFRFLSNPYRYNFKGQKSVNIANNFVETLRSPALGVRYTFLSECLFPLILMLNMYIKILFYKPQFCFIPPGTEILCYNEAETLALCGWKCLRAEANFFSCEEGVVCLSCHCWHQMSPLLTNSASLKFAERSQNAIGLSTSVQHEWSLPQCVVGLLGKLTMVIICISVDVMILLVATRMPC